MPDAADPALIELVSEIVAAYVAKNHVQAGEMPALISTVHATFAGLGREPELAAEPEKPRPAVSIKKSVTDEYLVSLEDGKRYKSLKRHLAGCGLTPADYRAKWGLPADYPMTAAATSRRRSEVALSMGLGAMRRKQ